MAKTQIDINVKAMLDTIKTKIENKEVGDAAEIIVEVPEISLLPEVALAIVSEFKGNLQFIFAVDKRVTREAFSLHHIFGLPSSHCFLHVVSVVNEEIPEFPSIALDLPSANWHERKVADMLGLKPVGHPDPRRLVMHEDWPDGFYPLRKDFDNKNNVPRVKGTYEFQKIDGEGVFEIPVGPVHAGIIEPGHFRFSSVGEKILHLELRMFYKHRGIERLMSGKTLLEGVMISERVSGDETVANSVAYSQAIEKAFELQITDRSKRLRAVLLELERIHCHLADIAGAATDIAYSTGAANAAILREQIMSLCESATGSRFLRGMVIPGGLQRDMDDKTVKDIWGAVKEMPAGLNKLESSLLKRSSVIDRFAKTGALSIKDALNLGTVGPIARASGIPVDSRYNYSYGYYTEHEVKVITRNDGDVGARVRIKFDEIRQSLAIIDSALSGIQDENIAVEINNYINLPAQALGWVEAPRGLSLCWLEIDDELRIGDCRWRTPSFNNWPALPYALKDDIVPDFPLVNKSFNLSYAGTDL